MSKMHNFIFMLMMLLFTVVPLTKAFQNLQTAFYTIQHTLCQLKLILNTDRTKLMVVSNARNRPLNLSPITTCQGKEIEVVTSCKYLGILIDDIAYSTTYKKNWSWNWDFILGIIPVFLFEARRRLVFTRLWGYFIYKCFHSVFEINWHPLPWHFEIYFKLQNPYAPLHFVYQGWLAFSSHS